MTIDLNADLGEGFPWDRLLLDRVTSASVCCGFHAGDPDLIAQTLIDAKSRSVIVGAHPGYPDREGFGRREQAMNREDVASLILGQVAALVKIASGYGVKIRFLKPHGALYNQALRDPEIAIGIVSAAKTLALPVLGQPNGEVSMAAIAMNVRFVPEGFADRGYAPNGSLIPRDKPGAILEDPNEIETQVLSLVARGFETLCIHGDHPRAVELADIIRATLARNGVAIRGFV